MYDRNLSLLLLWHISNMILRWCYTTGGVERLTKVLIRPVTSGRRLDTLSSRVAHVNNLPNAT